MGISSSIDYTEEMLLNFLYEEVILLLLLTEDYRVALELKLIFIVAVNDFLQQIINVELLVVLLLKQYLLYLQLFCLYFLSVVKHLILLS